MSVRSNRSKVTNGFNFTIFDNYNPGTNFPVHYDPNGNVDFIGFNVIPPSSVEGIRYISNIHIKVTANGNNDALIGTLQFVPEGALADVINHPANPSYFVNQLTANSNRLLTNFVIPATTYRTDSAVVTMSSAPQEILAYYLPQVMLHKGDHLVISFCTFNGLTIGQGMFPENAPVTITGTVSYDVNFVN